MRDQTLDKLGRLTRGKGSDQSHGLPAVRTTGVSLLRDFLGDEFCRKGKHRGRGAVGDERPNSMEQTTIAGAEQPVVADFDKAWWENVLEKAVDESLSG